MSVDFAWYPQGGADETPVGGGIPFSRFDDLRGTGLSDRNVRLREVSGLYDVPVRYTDRPRFGAVGSFPSPQFVGAKEFTVRFRVVADGPNLRDLVANLEGIRRALQPSTDGFGWFSWRERGGIDLDARERFVFCRVVDRAESQTVLSSHGKFRDMVVRFRAEDPHIYSRTINQHGLAVFSAGSGLDFGTVSRNNLRGIDFNPTDSSNLGGVDFPDSTPSSTLVQNKGNADAFVRFNVTAAGADLRVVELANLATGVVSVFASRDVVPGDDITQANGYDVIIPSGSQMQVDLNPNTREVLVDGVNSFSLWRRPQIPLAIQPGDNNLKYIADNPEGGNLVVSFRHTWL